MTTTFFKKKKVLITGGAGFIGSHLHTRLIDLGAIVTIADNLSSGSIENVLSVWKSKNLTYRRSGKNYLCTGGHSFLHLDLTFRDQARKAVQEQEIVFHLAANFGGRGYIEQYPASCTENFAIDHHVIQQAAEQGVDRLTFASTACVYPVDLQGSYRSAYKLKESDAIKHGWANADLEYGWAKLMGEVTMNAYHRQVGLQGSIVRYVTAYGPQQDDTHALVALILRALRREDPYVVWGTGNQDRDFTFIDDIVEGSLRACEQITDCTPINIGTSRRYTIKNVIELIFKLTHWTPKKVLFDRSKPEGVKTRALDNSLSYRLLGWKPSITLEQGLKKTIAWHLQNNPQGRQYAREKN